MSVNSQRRPMKKKSLSRKTCPGGQKLSLNTRLRVGDPVIVIAGGNEKKGRLLKGAKGKILRFYPKSERVVVEKVNLIKRHKKATSSAESGGILEKEGSVHISNVMYYSDALDRAVRLSVRELDDGRKVRGFKHPETAEFEQIDV